MNHRQSSFRRGHGCIACENCGRQTRMPHGSNVRACAECYDIYGIENEIADDSFYTVEGNRRIQALALECKAKGGNPPQLKVEEQKSIEIDSEQWEAVEIDWTQELARIKKPCLTFIK